MTRTTIGFVSSLCTALVLSFPALADGGCNKGKDDRMAKRVDHVSQTLSLSDEQRSRFTEMLQDLRTERLSMGEDVTREEKRSIMRSLVEEKRMAFREMLTAEQKEKLAADHPNFDPFRRPGRRHEKPDRHS